jgi:hypothetical protein
VEVVAVTAATVGADSRLSAVGGPARAPLGAPDGGTVTVYAGGLTVGPTGAVLASSGPRSSGGAVALHTVGDLTLSGRTAASGGRGALTQTGGSMTLNVGGNLTTAGTTVIDGFGQEQGGSLVVHVGGDATVAGTWSLEGGKGVLQKVGGTVEVVAGGDVLVSGTVDVSAQENWTWQGGVRMPTGAVVEVRGTNVTVTGMVRANGGSGAGIQVGGRVALVADEWLRVSGAVTARGQETLAGAGKVELQYDAAELRDGTFTPVPIRIFDFPLFCFPPCGEAPEPVCVDEVAPGETPGDSHFRRSWVAVGCVRGRCVNALRLSYCQFGCADGACQACDAGPCCEEGRIAPRVDGDDTGAEPCDLNSESDPESVCLRYELVGGSWVPVVPTELPACGAYAIMRRYGYYCDGQTAECSTSNLHWRSVSALPNPDHLACGPDPESGAATLVACSDHDLCTTDDHCEANACVGTPLECAEYARCWGNVLIQPHDSGTCENGTCVTETDCALIPVSDPPVCDAGQLTVYSGPRSCDPYSLTCAPTVEELDCPGLHPDGAGYCLENTFFSTREGTCQDGVPNCIVEEYDPVVCVPAAPFCEDGEWVVPRSTCTEYGCEEEEPASWCSEADPVLDGCFDETSQKYMVAIDECEDVTACRTETQAVPCPGGGTCSGGVCSGGDPCAGVVCDQPPPPVCAGQVLTGRYASSGTCSGGTCSYEPLEDLPCATSCTGGRCQDCDQGACCDTSSGTFAPRVDVPSEAQPCDTVRTFELECVGGCGGQVVRRETRRYCDGASSTCTDANPLPGDWQIIETCPTDARCLSGASGARCSSCMVNLVPEDRQRRCHGSDLDREDCDAGDPECRLAGDAPGAGTCDPATDLCVPEPLPEVPCPHGCTDGLCIPDPAVFPPDGEACDDGDDVCTSDDHWFGGVCIGTPFKCTELPCPDNGCWWAFPPEDIEPYTVQTAYGEQRVARDRVLVEVQPGVTRAQVDALAWDLFNSHVMSQIPSLDLYEIQVITSDASQLQSSVDALNQHPQLVANARMSAFATLKSNCFQGDDNRSHLPGRHNYCEWIDTNHAAGVKVFNQLLPHLGIDHHKPVRVAILDTGVESTVSFLSELKSKNRIEFIDKPPEPYFEDRYSYHGTRVASLIAANQDGDYFAGAASGFIGKRGLTLGVFRLDTIGLNVSDPSKIGATVPSILAGVKAARKWNAHVINMSLAYTDQGPLEPDGFPRDVGLFKKALSWPFFDPLVVVAAGNDGDRMVPGRTVPGGLALPEVLGVYGLSKCSVSELDAGSPYWPGANEPNLGLIAAPYRDIVHLYETGDASWAHGTSLGAAFVTSWAAVLKWLDEDLTPTQIKNLAYWHSESTAYRSGKPYPVVDFFRPIVKTAMDRAPASPSGWVRRLLDRPEPGVQNSPDGRPNILYRVCPGGFELVPYGYPPIYYDPFDHDTMAPNIVNFTLEEDENGVWIDIDADSNGVGLEDLKSATVDATTLLDFNTAIPLVGGWGTYWVPSESLNARVESGVFKFTRCQIVDRHNGTGEPSLVFVEGQMRNVSLMMKQSGELVGRVEVDDTDFKLPAWVMCLDASGLCNAIELRCVGGRFPP